MPRKKTHEEFVRDFNNLYGEEYEVNSKYINAITPIDIKHKKCGFSFHRTPNYLLSKKNCICPKCYPHQSTTRTIPYINDIYTTNKKLYDLLLNKEDGHKFKESSNKEIWFKCPYCGEHLYRKINSVNRQGLSCPKCGDGISYPEKFMYNLLSQLNIEFKYQYSPKWIQPYKYDFCFIYNNKKYIIEMDGGLGHGNLTFYNRQDDKGKIIDNYKDDLAKQHEYIIIRIDCNYNNISSRYDYIKNNIFNSELKNILNLNNINLKECDSFAEISILIKVSKLWNDNIRSYDKLGKELHINRDAIRNYLKKCSETKLIKESYEEVLSIVRKFSNEKLAISKGQKVLCNETGEIFNRYREANEKYHAELSNYFCKKYKTSGHLPDGTRLTWTKINN